MQTGGGSGLGGGDGGLQEQSLTNIHMLLSSLDNDVGGQIRADSMNQSRTLTLLNSVVDHQATMQGDLSSLLESFKNGLISADHLDSMIEVERVRSLFIVSESENIQKHLETLIQKLKNIADCMPMQNDVADDIEEVVTGMSSAARSMGGFAKVVKTPTREVTDVVTSFARTKAREEISQPTRMAARMRGTTTARSPVAAAATKGILSGEQQASLRPITDTSVDKKTAPAKPLAFDFGCQTDPEPIHTPQAIRTLSTPSDRLGMGEFKDDMDTTSAPPSPRTDGKDSKGKDKKRTVKGTPQATRQGSETKLVRGQSSRDKRSR